jgi:hypothetical protein
LRKTPGFTIVAVLTLALGIGATTSIFTLVHAVLLKSAPVSHPDHFIAWEKIPIAVSISDSFVRESTGLFRTHSTNTFATTRKASKSWRRLTRAAYF